jgi:hypothetical protein
MGLLWSRTLQERELAPAVVTLAILQFSELQDVKERSKMEA